MHRGYIYAKIPHLHSFYKYLYPEICRCPIHRAYLVSLDAVTHATDDKVFVGSIPLPVSLKYREDVKKVQFGRHAVSN